MIPASVRRELGLAVGDALVVSAEDGRLVLERTGAVLRRIRDRLAHIPSDVSLVEELLADRRAEAEASRDA